MNEIQGPGSNRGKKTYLYEFNRGVKLFKNALNEYSKTKEIHKKQQLKKVMSETLTAMKQIINQSLHNSKRIFDDRLLKDYNAFTANDSDKNLDRLKQDINDIKRSV